MPLEMTVAAMITSASGIVSPLERSQSETPLRSSRRVMTEMEPVLGSSYWRLSMTMLVSMRVVWV